MPNSTDFIDYDSPDTRARALACARGCYQRDLLTGYEAWSGSTLRGKASTYGYRYMVSRTHLLTRLHRAGLRTTYGPVAGARNYQLYVYSPSEVAP